MNTIKLNTIGERPIKKGGGGGEWNFIYVDTSSLTRNQAEQLLHYAYLIKSEDDEGYQGIFGYSYATEDYKFFAMMFDLDVKFKDYDPESGEITEFGLMDLLTGNEGLTLELFNALPRITKEEFFDNLPIR